MILSSHEQSPAAVPNRALYPLKEARYLLGGRSLASLYRDALEGRLRLTKINGRTYVSAAEIARLARGGE
ncbi:hypothetical protein [Methylocella sp.]|uniref:hypothetical protein n=1 Tax=Methylocella sp. TaxID=1978226 RepID=UPI0035B08421